MNLLNNTLYIIGLFFMSILVFSEMRTISTRIWYLDLIFSIICGVLWPLVATLYIGNKIMDIEYKWFNKKEEN